MSPPLPEPANGALENANPALRIRELQAHLSRHADEAPAWIELGQLLLHCGRLEEAAQAFMEAAALLPEDPAIRSALGALFFKLSMPREAMHWHGEALALKPDELLLQLNHLFIVPLIPESSQQVSEYRQRCLEGVERLVASDCAWQAHQFSAFHHPFYLIYHHCDDRKLLEAYATILGRVIPQAPPLHSEQTSGRLRIAFLSAYFCDHSHGRAFEGWIRNLDRSRFELILVHLHDSPQDASHERFNTYADKILTLSPALAKAHQQLIDLKLDVLFFTDIGMNLMATYLACSRFAPVQVTGWGVPQTSGMPMIDYYISGDLVDSEESQVFYSEQLIRVPGLPCCYRSDHLRYESRSREYFFLPEGDPLIGCPQNLWKLPAEFDGYLEQISRRVPEAWFVIMESDLSHHTKLFLQRLQQNAPSAHARVIVLSRMRREEFIALVAELDLLLDPPNFSSGVTMFDVLHTGTPFVAMEGRFLRSRFVAGAYRLIGLENPPIAASEADYIDLVVHLLHNPVELGQLRSRLKQLAKQHLYDRLEGLRAFEQFAIDAVHRAREQGTSA
jgi:protein O-GlcNAc transferase